MLYEISIYKLQKMCNSSKITENLKDICLSFEKRAALKFIGNFCSKFSLNFEEAYLNSSWELCLLCQDSLLLWCKKGFLFDATVEVESCYSSTWLPH